MEALAIIPARGGSKGISRKNLRPLAGKPLLAHVLGEALAARRVTRTVVSTEDAEIAAAAKRWGGEVVERPEELAGDEVGSEAVLLAALDRLREAEGYEPELVVFLQATAPLTTADDVDGTVEALLAGGADSAFAAVEFPGFLWTRGDGGRAEPVLHDASTRLRRQERAGQFVEAGSVYVLRGEGFRRHRHRFFGKTVLHPVPAENWLEIDEPRDLVVAEALLGNRRRRRRAAMLPARVAALVLDFDGVLTDDRVLVRGDGDEAVWCHRGDGLGIEMARRRGLPIAVMSREGHPVVTARCRKLGIEVHQGVLDKPAALREWLAAHRIDPAETVFVGNDLNDLGCLAEVGCGVAVADAHPELRAAAALVLERPGGRGAVRELIDLILSEREREPAP